MKTRRRTLLALSLSLAVTGFAVAQDKFPSKPVTVVVPQAAGGANDTIARVIAQKLSEQLGQTGPYLDLPGFGAIGEAMGGLRHLTGEPDRVPVRCGVVLIAGNGDQHLQAPDAGGAAR